MIRLKSVSTYLIILLTINISCFAAVNTIPDPDKKAKTEEWMARQKPLGFRENKGQMVDMEGKPVSFVLFKTETPNLNIWVTTTGLTYQFFKIFGEPEEMEQLSNGINVVRKKPEGKWYRVDMVLKSASIKKENIITEGDITQGRMDYYLGHCPDGIFNVKTYTKITIKEIYAGIDWVLYTSKEGGIKHDFIVHPFADPTQVKFIYEGSGKLQVKNNQIHFKNELGEVTEGELFCYQGNESNVVDANYLINKNTIPLYAGAGNSSHNSDLLLATSSKRIQESNIFSYEVSMNYKAYDNAKVLIIDPQLVWGTFIVSSGLTGPMAIECDINDNIYVTGYESGTGFPLQAWGGAYFNSAPVALSAFITCFNSNGNIIWSTLYAGTTGGTWSNALNIDVFGNIYIAGMTNDNTFPTQNLAGAYNQAAYGGANYDIFIIKFSSTGVRLWATFFGKGSSNSEVAQSITSDKNGNLYVVGYIDMAINNTAYVTFNWAGGDYTQTIFGGGSIGAITDAYLIRFDASNALTWSTLYGGSSWDAANSVYTDNFNNIYVTGITRSPDFPMKNWAGAYNDVVFVGGINKNDAFILRFTSTGLRTWSTYYGGSDNEYPTSIITDANDNIYISGVTYSPDFPLMTWGAAYYDNTLTGSYNGMIVRFSSNGVQEWSTYFGDNFRAAELNGMTIDNCGNIYIPFLGFTPSSIITKDAGCGSYYDSLFNTGSTDGFITKFGSDGTLLWATYLGGDIKEIRGSIATDKNNNIYVCGEWCGYNSTSMLSLPLVNPGGGAHFNTAPSGSDDGYIVKFIPDVPSFTTAKINSSTCSPCNGSATINLTCSEPNYSYVWSNGSSTLNSISATNTLTGLCPGTYTVTATSNCNQTQAATFVITGIPCGTCTLTGQFTKGTANCTGCGCKEWLMVNATGGTSPYSYSWSDGYDKRYKNQLCPGAYNVNIKDKNGCSVNVNLTVP